MRHHRLLRCLVLGFRFNCCGRSVTDAAAFSLSDLRLFGLDDDDGEGDGGCVPSSRRADVGAGPREGCDDWEESDPTEGECRVGVEGAGESLKLVRFEVDILGLWTAEGFGLAW